MALEGIDVSNVGQAANIDWPKVATFCTFAYIKATQSTDFVDPMHAHNVAAARALGLIIGRYHYWVPDTDPIAQARKFVSVTGPWKPGDLPPCVDVEMDAGQFPGYTPAMLINHLSQLMEAVESLSGKRPMLYTYPAFWQERMGNTTQFKQYPLWAAAYPGPPPHIGGWAGYVMHQYTDRGSVPGCAHVDQDRFYGTLDQLKAFCGIPQSPPPPPPPSSTNRYFPQTGQYISHGFKDAWERMEKVTSTDGVSGNMAMQAVGYPIGPETQATLSDGNTYIVQWFERTRFELHGDKVLMGLVGKELLARI